MKKNSCSKQKIIDAYYNEAEDEGILEHIKNCKECNMYYEKLKNAGKKMDLIKNIDEPVNPFAVNKIINVHLSGKEKRKVIREALGFFLGSSAFIGTLFGAVLAYDFKYAAAIYLSIFLIMPFLLIPAVLRRKEIN